MSFNRGAKRNSFGGRNFNRSGGGGDGGNPSGRNNLGGGIMGGLGGSSGGGGGGGGGVNPWESGMMPGRGLLPTPNNNLSLSSPQAQLVIASNLLSNLLRSQQDVQPQVPSLLSLGNTLNGPGPNFGGQQNFGPGRFNDRPMRHPMKNQRPQPYNKMGNRARDGMAGRRGPSAQQSRASQSANQRSNGNQNQHRNDKSSKPNSASKQNQTAKKEQQEVKASDKEKAETHVAKSDESEGTEEKKRDWKDEKKEGEIKEQETTEIEEETKESTTESEEKSTTPDNNKKVEDNQGGGKKSATRHAESRYAAVPMNHMFCHVCNKHMWDGFSFENHLRGRAHQLMMEKLDESYKLKVDLMRHELRVAEEQRELSLTNSKRRGKRVSVDLSVREYCTMCDLNFFGTLSSHRKSNKHQQLKTFLHPRCFPCMKEFPSRIEYDKHCLTPVHMKSMAQSEEHRKNKKKDKLAKGESEVRTAEDEEKDSANDTKSTDKEEELPENTEYITDFIEDMTLTNYRVPSLKHCRQNEISVGKSMVKEVQGWHCEKCRRFMLEEADMMAHLRSITHYRNFVQEFKALTATTSEAPAEQESKEDEDTNVKDDQKEEEDDDYEGDWKRRKVDHSKDEDEMTKQEEEAPANDENFTGTDLGGDKYDPVEADNDSVEEIASDEKPIDEENCAVNSPEKDTPVEKMWADIDNDNDPEIGNLIDDDIEDKYDNEDRDNIEEPEIQMETDIKNEPSIPEVPVAPVIEKSPVVALSQIQSPVNTPTPNTPTPNTPVANTPTANTPSANTPMANMSAANTPQSKSPRGGRGYGRGRGSQRARRSRR